MTTEKIINELGVLRKNIQDLQRQLQAAYQRIGTLSEQLYDDQKTKTESEKMQDELEPILEDS